jgi:hypothetical protein
MDSCKIVYGGWNYEIMNSSTKLDQKQFSSIFM